jgi:hypothetical protein
MYRYIYLIPFEGWSYVGEDIGRDFIVMISTTGGQNVTSGGTPNLHWVDFCLSNSLHRVGLLSSGNSLTSSGLFLTTGGNFVHRVLRTAT